MKRIIKNVAVLGSGVMGSRIACHFANIGCNVYLLDIVPPKLTDEEIKKGLTEQSAEFRNRIVNTNLQNVLKAKPESLYDESFASRIKTGNFEDNLGWLKECDWIIEAVVENLEIKKSVLEKVEKFRKSGTLVTTNTSGIPIHSMLSGRSEDFQQHFCGAHFFNPPRYLPLLEIIPTEKTKQEVVDFLVYYSDVFLGKTPVLCKDTPAFIANRIGVFSIMAVFKLMKELGLKVKEIDTLTGPLTGKPKSATFRTADVVGIDTLVKVANNIYKDCPNDEWRELFKVPDFVSKLVNNNWLGDKTGQGFYKKVKNEKGEKEILELNTETFEYEPSPKVKYASVTAAKQLENLKERIKALTFSKDKAGEFLKKLSFMIFQYSSNRILEIADEIYKVDDALRAGFGWELGPFETWDVLGVEYTIKLMEEENLKPAKWVYEMLKGGFNSFYKIENGKKKYYDINSNSYKDIPGKNEFIILDNYRANKPVWKNTGATLHDIGDGVLNLEFQTKMNSIGSEILEAINKSIEIAEKDFRGLVIGNDAQNFSAGANLAMMFMLATEQEYDEIDMAVRMFQQSTMRIRYSAVPVVSAPHGMTLGGGCEVCLHSDKVVASAETYIGLVEVGVGIIPAGGGTKEMTLRASDKYQEGVVELPILQEMFMNIAMAKVSTSAQKAFGMGILRNGRDKYILNQNRLINEAKKAVIELSDQGYTQPLQRNDIKVLGKSALAALLVGAFSFHTARYITEHDKKIAEKLAFVMCGGDLTAPTLVSEQYLLDLEREAFLSLIGEKKTLERIQSILTTGKPLRN
ncbi:3-hydroxyacyl-CoA dehydrogenase NAD-binding domain-containing protein [Melioribacteraceae bacterium 4301-Me]|uniref:3-hydroxyacyl-CoA dehydrogenase/enoyl-CoA hydratase family protein n=1 Tax=Pyranulibacter aquaticus TaxID=3163344 RepID=UPI00359985BD